MSPHLLQPPRKACVRWNASSMGVNKQEWNGHRASVCSAGGVQQSGKKQAALHRWAGVSLPLSGGGWHNEGNDPGWTSRNTKIMMFEEMKGGKFQGDNHSCSCAFPFICSFSYLHFYCSSPSLLLKYKIRHVFTETAWLFSFRTKSQSRWSSDLFVSLNTWFLTCSGSFLMKCGRTYWAQNDAVL